MRRFPLALALVVAILASPSAQAPTMETVLLGTSEPAARTLAVAINSRGVVAGTSATPNGEYAFTWTRSGGFRTLFQYSIGSDINDNGAVVGTQGCSEEEQCEVRGFVWTPSSGVRYLGEMWLPRAINNKGVIVGECGHEVWPRYCVWTNGVIRLLPLNFVATDINERNVVSGIIRDGTGPERAAVWASTFGLRNLSEGTESRAFAINDAAFIAGDAVYPSQNPLVRAAVWTPVGRAGAPQGRFSMAMGISNRGWVVGSVTDAAHNQRPALWLVGGRMITLPTPGASTPISAESYDVNDAGQIIGRYEIPGETTRAVMWIVR